jgi:hypothetical protein
MRTLPLPIVFFSFVLVFASCVHNHSAGDVADAIVIIDGKPAVTLSEFEARLRVVHETTTRPATLQDRLNLLDELSQAAIEDILVTESGLMDLSDYSVTMTREKHRYLYKLAQDRLVFEKLIPLDAIRRTKDHVLFQVEILPLGIAYYDARSPHKSRGREAAKELIDSIRQVATLSNFRALVRQYSDFRSLDGQGSLQPRYIRYSQGPVVIEQAAYMLDKGQFSTVFDFNGTYMFFLIVDKMPLPVRPDFTLPTTQEIFAGVRERYETQQAEVVNLRTSGIVDSKRVSCDFAQIVPIRVLTDMLSAARDSIVEPDWIVRQNMPIFSLNGRFYRLSELASIFPTQDPGDSVRLGNRIAEWINQLLLIDSLRLTNYDSTLFLMQQRKWRSAYYRLNALDALLPAESSASKMTRYAVVSELFTPSPTIAHQLDSLINMHGSLDRAIIILDKRFPMLATRPYSYGSRVEYSEAPSTFLGRHIFRMDPGQTSSRIAWPNHSGFSYLQLAKRPEERNENSASTLTERQADEVRRRIQARRLTLNIILNHARALAVKQMTE